MGYKASVRFDEYNIRKRSAYSYMPPSLLEYHMFAADASAYIARRTRGRTQ